MYFYQKRNDIQQHYYDAWKKAGFDGRNLVLDKLKNTRPSGHHYNDYYVKLADIRKHLHPYHMIDRRSTVVAGGCHDGKVTLGLSQPLIFSTLAKRVVVFEPDPHNIEFLQKYIDKYDIKNVEIIPRAIWNEETTVEFTVCNRTESNQIGKLGKRGRQIEVTATTLNKIGKEIGHIDFVHLTINGVELQAVQGATDLISEGAEFCIAMLFREQGMFRRRKRALDFLEECGYSIGCVNAPPRAWQNPPFYFATATKNIDKLKSLGFVACDFENIPWSRNHPENL